MKLNVGVVIGITTCEIVFKSERTSHKTDTEHVLTFDSTRSESGVIRYRPFSKMAAEDLNKSKLKTNTRTRKSILNLVTLPSFSISGERSAEKM